MKTLLNDRVLWYDGHTSVSLDKIYTLLLDLKPLDNIHVDIISDEVKMFNSISLDTQLTTKDNINVISPKWNIPENYLKLNLRKYFEYLTKIKSTIEQFDTRFERVLEELTQFELFGKTEWLKSVIYIIDIFTKNKVVWGTGRGSSCCLMTLYLVGVHNVDPLKYDLSIDEFFRG